MLIRLLLYASAFYLHSMFWRPFFIKYFSVSKIIDQRFDAYGEASFWQLTTGLVFLLAAPIFALGNNAMRKKLGSINIFLAIALVSPLVILHILVGLYGLLCFLFLFEFDNINLIGYNLPIVFVIFFFLFADCSRLFLFMKRRLILHFTPQFRKNI